MIGCLSRWLLFRFIVGCISSKDLAGQVMGGKFYFTFRSGWEVLGDRDWPPACEPDLLGGVALAFPSLDSLLVEVDEESILRLASRGRDRRSWPLPGSGPEECCWGPDNLESDTFFPELVVWLVPQPDVDGWAWWSHDWVLVDPSTEVRVFTRAYITLSLLSGLITQAHAHLHIVSVSALHIVVGDGVFPPAAAA